MSRLGRTLRVAARAALWTAIGLLPACGGDRLPIKDEDVLVELTTSTRDVALGRAFPLAVVRTWARGLVPSTFDERALSPLVARLVSTSLREDGDHAEETRRYLAYAFTLEPLVVPAFSFEVKARDGTSPRTVKSEPLQLRVAPSLDPKAPGAPEGPGRPRGLAPRWWPYAAGGFALVALALLAWARRRRDAGRTQVPPSPPSPVGPGPEVEALASLTRLRERRGEVGADIVETGDIVRGYAAGRFTVPAQKMTSRELIAAIPSWPSDVGSDLSVVLGTCDLVKFADHAPTTDERLRVLDAALAFVRATTGSAP